MGKDIVKSAHDTFIRAVQDLISLSINLYFHKNIFYNLIITTIIIDYDIRIDLGFIRLALYDKSLKYAYEKNFANTMNLRTFE